MHASISGHIFVADISDFTCMHPCSQELEEDVLSHLFEHFDTTGVTLERATFACPAADSSYGLFSVILRGDGSEQLAAEMRQRSIPDLTLNNGQTVTLKVCANDCSLEGAASNPISNLAGVIVAAMFVIVVVAGLALLIVILVKYRR